MKIKKEPISPALAGSRQKRENYIFATGKIRSLERFLIKDEIFQEAIESNLEDALRLFMEAGLYNEELLHVQDSQNLEDILSNEQIKLRNLMKELLLDKEFVYLVESDGIDAVQKLSQSGIGGFLKDYLKHLIDMHNIKTFLRLYLLKEKEGKLNNLLVNGGFVAKEALLKLYNHDLSVFLTRLEYIHKDSQIIDYSIFLKDAIKNLQEKKTFLMLEKAISNFLIHILKEAKYISFGLEPLLAYYFAKSNEINLMRMIILAKLNNLSNELVKERLNAVYA